MGNHVSSVFNRRCHGSDGSSQTFEPAVTVENRVRRQ